MTENIPDQTPAQDHPETFEIRLKGHLDARRAGWFEGMRITLEEDGVTLLSGPRADQAALHGLLKKIRDLGIPLISLTPVETEPPDAAQTEMSKTKKRREK